MLETVFYFPWEVNLILFIQSTFPDLVRGLFKVIADVVNKNVLALIFISVYLAYNKDWGKFTLLSLGVAGVCCEFIKVTVGRLRPYAAVDKIKCIHANVPDQNPLDFKIQGYSFPSGHTMMGTNLFLAIPAYIRKKPIYHYRIDWSICCCVFKGRVRCSLSDRHHSRFHPSLGDNINIIPHL